MERALTSLRGIYQNLESGGEVIAKYRRAGEKRRARGDPDRRGRPGADADDNEDDRLVCCHLFPRYDGQIAGELALSGLDRVSDTFD